MYNSPPPPKCMQKAFAQACPLTLSLIKCITYGNAGKSNNICKDVGPDGFGARPAAAFGKEVDEGEDPVLTNTLWRRESQCQLRITVVE